MNGEFSYFIHVLGSDVSLWNMTEEIEEKFLFFGDTWRAARDDAHDAVYAEIRNAAPSVVP